MTDRAVVTYDAGQFYEGDTPIAGIPPTGTAGGVLDGTYPNPGLAASVAGAGLAETSDVLSVNVDGTTLAITTDVLGVKAGGIGATELAATAVTAGTYGDTSNVGQFTVDADGRITAASNVAITGGGGSGYTEVTYNAITSGVNITATTEATANTIVTASSFTADGTSAYLIEFFAPAVRPDTGAIGRILDLYLYEGSGSVGQLAQFRTPAAQSDNKPAFVACRLVPASGSRTYSVRGDVSAGTGVISAGAGGSGNLMPAYIRITKVT